MDSIDLNAIYESYMQIYEDVADLDEGFKPTNFNTSGKKAQQIRRQIDNLKSRGKHDQAMVLGTLARKLDRPEEREYSREISRRNKFKKDMQARRDAQRDEKKSRKQMKDSYDHYDIVLEYLLGEGLCESVENAEIMMAHMSEAWIDDILESSTK